MQKDQNAILRKLGIPGLNPMQREAILSIRKQSEIILLSPTGSGKTLAFLLPLLAELDPAITAVQALILVPSRELAIQIEQVAREMGSGFKVNAIYGGRSTVKDKKELQHPPTILIGTPGRVADHLRRETFTIDQIRHLVLDEFDKSLETGFEKDMTAIVRALPNLQKKILTSATEKVAIPDFVGLIDPIRLDYLQQSTPQIQLRLVEAPKGEKLLHLKKLLGDLGDKRGIIFCNFKDSIQVLSDYLDEQEIVHTCFFGGLEQVDRERSLIKFRNETHRLLVATDLAARGIDVPELDFIIHYELPTRADEFVHRNGRTARMQQDGTVFLLREHQERIPEFIEGAVPIQISESQTIPNPKKETLFISGGRGDKISKGDIVGLFLKQGGLKPQELGTIELKQDCAFVAVPKSKARQLAKDLNNTRLKKKKVRIRILD